MNKFIKLSVSLTQDEWFALRDVAEQERRIPAEQACHMLGKLLSKRTTNKNSKSATGKVSEAETVSAFAGINP